MEVENINGLCFVTDGVECLWGSDKVANTLKGMNTAEQIGQLQREQALSHSERALVQRSGSKQKIQCFRLNLLCGRIVKSLAFRM